MSQKQKSGGLDIFRIIAALLVISIHTSPFSGISENLDFFVTRIVARVAVPFFFMVTGQYILSDFYNQNRKNKPDASKIWNYIKKLFFMYIISIIIYIPIGIYAGHYRGLDLLGALKMLLFDGTFYHLWYFPACIIGVNVILSRANGKFLEELFKVEVPEINEGIVEIKNVQRDPGFRAKVMVSSIDSKIDPIGT